MKGTVSNLEGLKPDEGTLAPLSFGQSLHRQNNYQGGRFLKGFLASLSIQHETPLHRYLQAVSPLSPTPFPKQTDLCARVPHGSSKAQWVHRYRVKTDFPAAPTIGLILPLRSTEWALSSPLLYFILKDIWTWLLYNYIWTMSLPCSLWALSTWVSLTQDLALRHGGLSRTDDH